MLLYEEPSSYPLQMAPHPQANYGGSAEQADSRGVGNYRGWFSASASGITGYVYP